MCKEGTFGKALLYISELIATQLRRPAPCRQRWHRLKDLRRGGPQGIPLSERAVLDFFRVRCSANRSGDPIVAEKRPDYYAINYPELQARIEIAHHPLIEVNDAARR